MSQIFASKRNSTTTPLGAGATFVGETDILSSYQEVDVNVAFSPEEATGTLYLEFSPDDVHWDVSITRSIISGIGSVPIILRVVLPYYRVRFVNGVTPLSELRLTTVLHRETAIRLTRFLDQAIDLNEPVELVRIAKSVLPDGAASEAKLEAVRLLVAAVGTEATLAAILALLSDPLARDVTDRAARLVGHVTVDSAPAVTGTVAVSNMIAAVETGLAKDATLTARLPAALTAGGGVKTGLTDALPSGTNTVGKVDQGVAGASAWKVDGSAVTQPVSGSVAVSNFPATVDVADRANRLAGHVQVDNFPSTQPVSGTVAVSNMIAAVETGLAKDTTLTGGTVKAIARGGAKGATVAADVTATSVDVNHTALDVDVKASALPTGASTSDLQGTANTTLAAINTKIPADPAQEHTSAVNPHASRLTNGSVFYQAGTETTLSTRAADTTVGSVRDRLPSSFSSGGGLQVGLVDALPPGTNNIGTVDVFEVEKKLYDLVSSTVQYIGKAPLGTSTSAPAWRIKRLRYSAVTGDLEDSMWSSSTATWTDRASESYT